MAMRGDHDRVAEEGGYSFHSVRPDAYNYVWVNSIEPVLEVDSGEIVDFIVRDASDEQIRADSTSEDVAKLDFNHVNPVSGPVYVRGHNRAMCWPSIFWSSDLGTGGGWR
jgi:acetamidase/formamidase family protein